MSVDANVDLLDSFERRLALGDREKTRTGYRVCGSRPWCDSDV